MGFSSGFAPLAGAQVRLVILGSLPGRASLAAGQYYAQPRNAFWPLMGALFDAGPAVAYPERVQRLVRQGIAVWDVCAAARRAGSLDAAIDRSSVRVNDFAAFFAARGDILQLAFNGLAAAELYRRRVLPGLGSRWAALPRLTLPSTSPAHAAMPFAEKLRRWSVLQQVTGGRPVEPN
jgi:hypoxanthine-DNA glycosylase